MHWFGYLWQATAHFSHTVRQLELKSSVLQYNEANPYLGATKIAKVRVILNPDYQKQVNDQREAEGKEADFEASERKWGNSLGNGIIEKNGNLYVSYIHVETLETKYFFDGAKIEYSKLKPFVPVKKSTGNQGVDKEVQFRMVAVENILDWF